MVHFDYIVIKPIGLGSSLGMQMADTSAANLNKGHIINAGIYYLLESGNLKVLSTTGAVLLELNVGMDINPSGFSYDEIASIISSPNPEDMFIMIMTKTGKVHKYQIVLERKVDAASFLRNETEPENPNNITQDEEMRQDLRKARFQSVQYDYVINEKESGVFEMNTENEGGAVYSKLLFFFAKGHKWLVSVKNEKDLVFKSLKSQKTQELKMHKNMKIKDIQRYSAFVLVQYENLIEFVQFDRQELINTQFKIALTDPIRGAQPEIQVQRYLFVQTDSQILLYDCDGLLQQQYNQIPIISQQLKGCEFVKKLLSGPNAVEEKIVNFKTMQNTILVYFESGRVGIYYVRDLVLGLNAGKTE